MPEASVISFNIADLPWPFEKADLRAIPGRIQQIRDGLATYEYRLVQEDWFQRMTDVPCGHWYWFPSGLTLGAPSGHPPQDVVCQRHARAGLESGDILAKKGWQAGTSQGVRFVHTHLDAGDSDFEYRKEQATDIVTALPTSGPMVLAGDLNTETPAELAWMDGKFGTIGLDRAPIVTQKAKDHIYTRDVTVLQHDEDTSLGDLSDHPAVWVRIEWS